MIFDLSGLRPSARGKGIHLGHVRTHGGRLFYLLSYKTGCDGKQKDCIL
jgi:hypothetical protein